MANIKTWLENAEKEYGEAIEAIVIGPHYNRKWDYEDTEEKETENILINRAAALEKLDLDFNNGYGGADCYPIYAWTKSRVFYIYEYDGATSLKWVPRHPIDIEPKFNGEY